MLNGKKFYELDFEEYIRNSEPEKKINRMHGQLRSACNRWTGLLLRNIFLILPNAILTAKLPSMKLSVLSTDIMN